MGKRITLTLLQFIAFLGLMFVGGDWDVIRLGQEISALQTHGTFFNPIPTIKYQIGATHILIANGIFFAAALLVLILLIEAIAKKLKPWAGYSFLAFILAVVIGFTLKMGLLPA
jgi:hypothetical protein